jgi:porin
MKISPIYSSISRWLLLMLFLSVHCTAVIHAQTLTSSNGEQASAGFSWLENDHLLADLPYRKQLADSNGVTFNGQLINDMLWNTMGGASVGNGDTGVLQFGLDADMKKLAGVEGGTFHTSWLWLYGKDINANVANAFSVSGIAANPAFRCYELWYQQAFLNNLFSLRGGLLAIDTDFSLSDTAALFVNSSFGLANLGTFNLVNSGPQYPMATPGIRLEINPTGWLSLHSIFAQANPFSQQENQHNFNWNFGSSGGLLSINEAKAAWKTLLKTELPGSAKAGFWIQSGSSPSLPEEFSFTAPSNLQYSTGFYGILDQAIYQVPDEGKNPKPAVNSSSPDDSVVPEPSEATPRGLNAFVRGGFCPQPDNPMSLFVDSGLVYTGLLPCRKADRLGLAFAYGQVSPGYRTLAGQQEIPGASFEAVTELTYSIQLTPAITLQPDLQYVLHPGGTQQYGNALVAGFRATVTF